MNINFFEENIESYNFEIPKDDSIYVISIKNEISWYESIHQIVDFLNQKTAFVQKPYIIYFWAKTSSFFKTTRVIEKKNIFNNVDLNWISKEQSTIYKQEKNNLIFYSVISIISEKDIELCLDYSRKNSDSFIFVSEFENIDKTEINSFLGISEKKIEDIINFFYERNFIYIRPIGNFDDKELIVEFFGTKKILDKYFRH